MKKHRLISSDSHINEHPDTWKFLPDTMKDRGPQVVDLSNGGQGWVMEGQSRDPLESGLALSLTAVVYRSTKRYDRAQFKNRFQEYKDGYNQGIRFDDILPGSWDPKARLEEQDEDGVEAEIFYNNPVIWAAIKSLKDPALTLACFRSYNDWMAEYESYNPRRLVGNGLVPSTGIEDAVSEARRCIETLGLRAISLESWPNGSLVAPSPEDDQLWGYLAETGVPLSLHIGFAVSQNSSRNLAQRGSTSTASPITEEKAEAGMPSAMELGAFPNVLSLMILNGVFERFPGLKFVGAEINSGWIPDYFRNFDLQFQHLPSAKRAGLSLLPSEYLARNVSVTFLPDYFGVRSRDRIGRKNMMWSSDFPHSVSNWPIDGEIAYDQMVQNNVPEEDAEALLWKNCADLYGLQFELDAAPDQASAEVG